MGHVDHGKTSLLDAIRKSNVADGEAGAITQHIGAYRVETPKGVIVFLDTPGHEAFTAMRARGAQATDIVVLVVSATDGVMPQTIEAIDHAKAAGAPIMVAINKIDLPGAQPDRIKQELSAHGLSPEEWGGKNIMVELSAKKRINIDKLLDQLAIQAEVMELKANPDKRGVAFIIEAKRDAKRGVVAHVLVQSGSIKVGDPFVVGTAHGRVRALMNEFGQRLEKVGPSEPVEILGINGEPPQVGDMVYVTENEKEARQIAEKRKLAMREDSLAHQKHVTLLGLRSQLDAHKLKTLQVILKGDVQGSIQAIRDSLERLSTEEVEIKIIHAGPGNVNESDILLAKASDAIILGFNICSEPKAETEAEREGIEIRNYSIIFELIGDVRAAMEGLLEPEIVELITGRAEVRQVFALSAGTIAGSFVVEGKIVRGQEGRVLRGKDTVYKGKITGLKRFKEDVKDVEKGFECGILMEGYRQFPDRGPHRGHREADQGAPSGVQKPMPKRTLRLAELFKMELTGWLSRNPGGRPARPADHYGRHRPRRTWSIAWCIIPSSAAKPTRSPPARRWKGWRRRRGISWAKLRLKKIPVVIFRYDDTPAQAAKVEEIFNRINAEEKPQK